jgi:hypothetical protein
MHTPISQQTKVELLQALRQRYLRASKQEKAKILDEFVAVAGCHRKHAIRLLSASNSASASVPAVARRTYPALRTVPLGTLPRHLRMILVDEMEQLASANLATHRSTVDFPLFCAGYLRRRRPVALPICTRLI